MLSIHIGEDKTKSILFTSKNQIKNICTSTIYQGDDQIKQHSKVTYLGCILNGDLFGQSMQWYPKLTHELSRELHIQAAEISRPDGPGPVEPSAGPTLFSLYRSDGGPVVFVTGIF